MLYFLFAERLLTALIAVNIQSPCYVTNAEYYVAEFFIKGLQKHQGFIITTTVKPFYGTTTRGSGLNRLIKIIICTKMFRFKTSLCLPAYHINITICNL